MADKRRKGTIFSSRVERAAAEFIGSAEKVIETKRQNRGRRYIDRTSVGPIRRKARKRFAEALPGSTPRLRRDVIRIVGHRLSQSFKAERKRRRKRAPSKRRN